MQAGPCALRLHNNPTCHAGVQAHLQMQCTHAHTRRRIPYLPTCHDLLQPDAAANGAAGVAAVVAVGAVRLRAAVPIVPQPLGRLQAPYGAPGGWGWGGGGGRGGRRARAEPAVGLGAPRGTQSGLLQGGGTCTPLRHTCTYIYIYIGIDR